MSNLNELDPFSPEYEAALAAAEAKEDEQAGNAEPAATEAPAEPKAEDGEAKAVAPEAPAAPSDPKTEPTRPVGVLSKDGQRVYAYDVLAAERRAARSERRAREAAEAELEAARKLIEDLKAGKTPEEPKSDDLTESDLEDLAMTGPAGERAVAKLREAREALAKAAPEAPKEPEQDPKEALAEAIQEAIDSVPTLLDWQLSDPEKFARAVEVDKVLQKSPKWGKAPLAERFERVASLVAEEFDVAYEAPRKSETPSKAEPTRRAVPSTLSDMKGGSIDIHSTPVDRLNPAAATAHMSKWTDAEIDAYLAKHGDR